MENYCTNVLFPEFSIWTQFVTDTLLSALDLDSMENSHPIEVEVGHPDEVDEIFDNISYNKGASVIRMLHDFIGNDAFRRGMNSYLMEHAYKNAQTEDLWRSLEEASKKPVGEIMSTWTSQMGFPVIKVEKVEHENNNTTLTLTQEKFNANGTSSEEYSWKVPITLITSKGHTQSCLMEGKEFKILVKDTGEDDWVKLNNDFIGYYRVQYQEEYLKRFQKANESKELSELNRLSLLDDTMTLVKAGRVSADVVMQMISGFKGEDSYVVWRSINSCFAKLDVILHDQECYGDFKKWVGDLMGLIVDSVGWEPAQGIYRMNASFLKEILCRIGNVLFTLL